MRRVNPVATRFARASPTGARNRAFRPAVGRTPGGEGTDAKSSTDPRMARLCPSRSALVAARRSWALRYRFSSFPLLPSAFGQTGCEVSADGQRFLASVPMEAAEASPMIVVTNWQADLAATD